MATKISKVYNVRGASGGSEILETQDIPKLTYYRNRFNSVCYYATWPAKDEQAAVELVGQLAKQRSEKVSNLFTYPSLTDGHISIRWTMK